MQRTAHFPPAESFRQHFKHGTENPAVEVAAQHSDSRGQGVQPEKFSALTTGRRVLCIITYVFKADQDEKKKTNNQKKTPSQA